MLFFFSQRKLGSVQADASLGPRVKDSVGFRESRPLCSVSNSYLCPRFSRSASSNEIGHGECATLGGKPTGERREKVSVSFAVSLRSL